MFFIFLEVVWRLKTQYKSVSQLEKKHPGFINNNDKVACLLNRVNSKGKPEVPQNSI